MLWFGAIEALAGGENSSMMAARTSQEAKAIIDSELRVGASGREIEDFLNTQGLKFSYDKFAKRYQSIIRDVPSRSGMDKAIIIYLYVTDEKRLLRSEVRESYTGP
jgi:hypothetical protein